MWTERVSGCVFIIICCVVDVVVSIGGKCGKNCTWSYDYQGNLTISGTGSMDGYPNKNAPWSAFKDSITSVTIEEGVTFIGQNAFWDCIAMESAYIPSTSTGAGSGAFYHTGLKSVVIPPSWKTLSNSLFQNCENLAEVSLSSGLELFQHTVFGSCKSLKSIILPETVTVVGSWSFAGCCKLVDVVYKGVDDPFEYYGRDFFSGCPGIKRCVTVPISYSSKEFCSLIVTTRVDFSSLNDSSYHTEVCEYPTSSWSADSSSPLTAGAIVGICVAAVVLLGVIALIAFFVLRRRKDNDTSELKEVQAYSDPYSGKQAQPVSAMQVTETQTGMAPTGMAPAYDTQLVGMTPTGMAPAYDTQTPGMYYTAGTM